MIVLAAALVLFIQSDVCASNGECGASGFNGCLWCDLGFPNQDCKSPGSLRKFLRHDTFFLAFGTNSSIVKSCPSAAVETTGSKYFRVLHHNCFLFMTYDTVAYEIAKTKCQDYGGNLAMPKTKAINDFLVQEMKSFDKPRPMWIGMHDKAIKDRKMVWEDGSHVDSWGNFDWTKDGLFGGGEDCITLDPNDGKWHDYGCSKTGILSRLGVAKNAKLPFICQYPVQKDDARKINRNSGKTKGDQDGCNDVENGSQVKTGDDDKMQEIREIREENLLISDDQGGIIGELVGQK